MRSTHGQFPIASRHRATRKAVSLLLFAFLANVGGCGDGAPNVSDAASKTPVKPTNPDAVVLPDARGTAGPSVSQTSLVDSPPVEIVPSVLDFGFIPPNQDAEGSVEIFNRGTEPLMILAAEPSCKCTTLSDLGGTVIPPGESVDLTAVLEGAPNTGPKTASVKVLFDGYSVVEVVDLRAEITLPVRAIPPHINAVRNQNRQGRIVVESIDGVPFSICSFHGLPPTYLGFDPTTDEPRSQYILSYDLDRLPAPYPRYLVIETDRPETPMIDVYLRHETTLPKPNRNLRMSGGFRFPLGLIQQGSSVDFEVEFDTVTTPIATVISESPDCRAQMLGIATEETEDGIITRVKIRATPASDYVGVLYASLSAMTADGQVAPFHVFGVVSPDGEPCVGPTRTPVPPPAGPAARPGPTSG